MNVIVRKFTSKDVEQMNEIWNEVVDEGIAFPQTELLNSQNGAEFYNSQTYCGVAEDIETKQILGMYILHPNNVGRCGHICNASYAVSKQHRGKKTGKALVQDCIEQAKNCGFKILQFNAVVSTNMVARRLYEQLGFVQLGVIPNGFLLKNGRYEDICPYYRTL